MKLKNLLIASPTNNYRPWILSKTAMACFVLSVWTLRLFMPGYIATGAPGLDSSDLMARINTERTSRLLPALITNSKLSTAASLKSQDMINREYFAHVDPDGNYAWPIVEAQGYKPYKSLGENLAVDFSSAASVVNAWMNSPGHRTNILSEKYDDQGMAAISGEFEDHETYLVTNLFGALMKTTSPSPTPAPAQTQETSPAPSQTPTKVTPITNPNPTPVAVAPNQAPATSSTLQETITSEQPSPTSALEQTPTQETPTLIEPNSQTPVTTATPTERADLKSLKVVIGIFAGLYTFFLIIDSLIIHRAKIRRENISPSPHAVMMLLIAVVNFFTIWI